MNRTFKDYILGEKWLTKQERLVLQVTLTLLLIGWAVQSYRTAHPPLVATVPAEEAKK